MANKLAKVLSPHHHLPLDLPVWVALWPCVLTALMLLIPFIPRYLSLTGLILIGCAVPAGLMVLRGVARYMGRCSAYPRMRNLEGSCSLESGTDSARLICYGSARELSDLSDMAPEHFGPVVFEPAIDYTPRRLRDVTVGVYFGAVVACRWLNVSLFYASSAFVAAYWIRWVLVWRQMHYFRVVPGRIDVMHRRLLRSDVSIVRSVRLKDARIVCRYDKGTLTIQPEEPHGGEPLEVDLSAIAARHRFVATVFRSAMCQECTAPLPKDAFVG